MIQLLILTLSTISLIGVRAILRADTRWDVVPPAVLAPVADEGYFDTRGLV